MTESKHLKARIRARMARTGERYTTARRHIVGTDAPGPVVDHGWTLRGGVHPDTAALSNVLAHHGAGVSEAMVLGIGGGLGAGYILWEFEVHHTPTLVLGFRNQWQYPGRWGAKTLKRLGIPFALHETGGARGAAQRLDAALAAGRPAIAMVDRQEIGFWHLPKHLSGRAGYPVVVYAERARPDAPSTTATSRRSRSSAHASTPPARASAPSSTGSSSLTRSGRSARRRCERRCGQGSPTPREHLAARSDSFGLPAWRKWARMLVDTPQREGVAARVRRRHGARRRAALGLRGHRAGWHRRRSPARAVRDVPRRGRGAAGGAAAGGRRGRLPRARRALARPGRARAAFGGRGARGAARGSRRRCTRASSPAATRAPRRPPTPPRGCGRCGRGWTRSRRPTATSAA